MAPPTDTKHHPTLHNRLLSLGHHPRPHRLPHLPRRTRPLLPPRTRPARDRREPVKARLESLDGRV